MLAFGGVLRKPQRPLDPHWGDLWASWSTLETILSHPGLYLNNIGCHLGLSNALWEPSWAIWSAPAPPRPPVQTQGEG
eukprot:5706671-Pyramimonas_sp.AAC.1